MDAEERESASSLRQKILAPHVAKRQLLSLVTNNPLPSAKNQKNQKNQKFLKRHRYPKVPHPMPGPKIQLSYAKRMVLTRDRFLNYSGLRPSPGSRRCQPVRLATEN